MKLPIPITPPRRRAGRPILLPAMASAAAIVCIVFLFARGCAVAHAFIHP